MPKSAWSLLLIMLIALLPACGGPIAVAGSGQGPSAGATSESLTIYSGRSEELVGPVIEQFREATGIDVEVRYGTTSEMAATLLEEGDKSRADIFLPRTPEG